MKLVKVSIAALGLVAFAGAASACPFMSKEAAKPTVTADTTILPAPKAGS